MSVHDGDLPTEFRADADGLPERRFAAGELVSERYRIVAELGRGGMGHVFRAEDMRLGQPVALKFLPVRTAGNAELLDRLVAEVRIGRAVSHPNVCRIYDIVDTADGLHFIAMEFVDGEDLASLLRRIGRFTIERGVQVAHDICQGLAAAHDQGIVHRDLKPANVMIDSRGRARITDFGLAISHGDARGREMAGTPPYMAPEQLRGERADFRSDLYALGVLLCEMFTGRRLYDGTTAAEITRQHLRPKAPPSSMVRDLPAELDRAVLACLEELPQDRPSSARAVAAMLPAREETEHQAARETPRSREQAERSVAVMPFENLGGAAADDVFTLGLADEIISDLAKVRELRVISRGSVMPFRGNGDLVAVGRELQVAYVLNGSILRSGDQLRLNANLVDAQTAEIIWSEKFRASMADIFDIQETVARTVAAQLRAQVSAEESAHIAQHPIRDPIAWEYYVRARAQIMTLTAEGIDVASDLLRRAESLVGENAAILDAKASAEWQLYNTRVDPDPRHLQRVEELAARIVTLDPAASSAFRLRGLVALSRGSARSAIRELRLALDRDPNDPEAAFWLLMLYSSAGRTDLARPVADELAKRDPFSITSLAARGYFTFLSGDAEAAMQIVDLMRNLHPQSPTVAWLKGTIFAHLGRDREAARAWSELVAGSSDNIFRQLAEFFSAAVRKDREEAMRVYREKLQHTARETLVHGADVAIGLAAVGEIDASVDWLENAVRRGFLAADRIERSPLVAAALADPRFRRVLETMRRESAAIV